MRFCCIVGVYCRVLCDCGCACNHTGCVAGSALLVQRCFFIFSTCEKPLAFSDFHLVISLSYLALSCSLYLIYRGHLTLCCSDLHFCIAKQLSKGYKLR